MGSALRSLYRRLRAAVGLRPTGFSTMTGFFRNPIQLETILQLSPQPSTVYFFGCSNGCEPYSFAIQQAASNPTFEPTIVGFDINPACIEEARTATYELSEIDYYGTGD